MPKGMTSDSYYSYVSRFYRQVKDTSPCKTNLLCLLCLSLVLSTCSHPIATQASNEECRLPFEEVADLVVPGLGSEETIEIVTRLVEAGEFFLNNCVDPKVPVSTQPNRLEELKLLAQIMRTTLSCTYKPIIQFVDLNKDDIEELVLHTQALRCDITPWPEENLLGGGGVSIVYEQDQHSKQWKGTLIWPCSNSYGCPPTGAWTQSPEPLVLPLGIQDSEKRAFVMVVGGYIGADHIGKLFSIWRWDSETPEIELEFRLHDWCSTGENWDAWEITEEGFIMIPATQETTRCPAREATFYALEGDEFVERNP